MHIKGDGSVNQALKQLEKLESIGRLKSSTGVCSWSIAKTCLFDTATVFYFSPLHSLLLLGTTFPEERTTAWSEPVIKNLRWKYRMNISPVKVFTMLYVLLPTVPSC